MYDLITHNYRRIGRGVLPKFPEHIAVDQFGYLYVVCNGNVYIFTTSGKLVTTLLFDLHLPGQSCDLKDEVKNVAVDLQGRLLVLTDLVVSVYHFE